MNERIQELAEKAERLAEDELAHLERVHNRLYSFTEGREIYNQKFALLIVMESIEHLESSVAVPNIEHSRTKTKCISSIKEHFGVEIEE